MKWDEKVRVNPGALPLNERLKFAWIVASSVTRVNGKPANLRLRALVFWQALTANEVVVEEGEDA